ncbi:MAG: hypothetical protein UY67_C0006G0038 [Candidatus Kaiserbacteria bacterium GW2011_GWA2_52_12]|uniref:VWFA domain-containing protein n=1 Tax=Candidatus Kaiserbacteria bacterium GW2011_GWA2_52_12 TaxID=1618671 RepID=A0A0G1X0E1_9BACT|nr:MAG: hypothetical protein UY67_C0006G0038 [Candidatus Kaiserbacteria bacterium GW2011_GWA2_52_12]
MPKARDFEILKSLDTKTEPLSQKLDDILSKRQLFGALQIEEYESAKDQYDRVRALNDWRQRGSTSPARSFYRLFEEFSELGAARMPQSARSALAGLLADRLSATVRQLSPRATDLFRGILSQVDGTPYEPRFEMTKGKLAELSESGDLQYLLNPRAPLASKTEYLTKRFDNYIAGANVLDERDRTKEQEQGEVREKPSDDPIPPPAREESEPSMDEMSRLEKGEKPTAIWKINPAYGGYFREQSFDTWDPERKVWKQSDYAYEEDKLGQGNAENDSITISANVQRGAWTRVKSEASRLKIGAPEASAAFPERFTEDTERVIAEIEKTKQGNRARGFALARYVMQRLQYSNESQFNNTYRSDPNGYCFAIDTHKKADCDVGNTYFAALCARLGVPARHVVGHMVKGKNEKGTSMIHSGTGHAWSEIWDDQAREWMRVDATPPGDPIFNSQIDQEGEGGESAPGDYGGQEDVGPTDEQLQKLEEELAKHVEELSYTPEERALAEEAKIELSEARDIAREIAQAEDARLKDGRKVTNALSQLFDMIVDSRLSFESEYSGPLRRREGGERIDDIVAQHIGAVSGEQDPRSRIKETETPKEEQLFGGFDVWFIDDKSGSMSQTVDGAVKWKTQRTMNYLLLSALHRFQEKLVRSGVAALPGSSLDVRTEVLSFRGGGVKELDVDKPLSPRFEAAEKVTLWRSLGNQGSGNGDVQALQTVLREIKEDIKATEAGGKKDNRLRIVLPMSDGEPDDPARVHALAEELGNTGAVVVGLGLTDAAKSVKQIYTTPKSRGETVKDLNHLPVIVARHIVSEALKLFPDKGKGRFEYALKALVGGFQEAGSA